MHGPSMHAWKVHAASGTNCMEDKHYITEVCINVCITDLKSRLQPLSCRHDTRMSAVYQKHTLSVRGQWDEWIMNIHHD